MGGSSSNTPQHIPIVCGICSISHVTHNTENTQVLVGKEPSDTVHDAKKNNQSLITAQLPHETTKKGLFSKTKYIVMLKVV